MSLAGIILAIVSLLTSIFLYLTIQKIIISIELTKEDFQTEIIRLTRALSRHQAEAYSNTVCSNCKTLLPEDSVRTHDGKWLCSNCKVGAN